MILESSDHPPDVAIASGSTIAMALSVIDHEFNGQELCFAFWTARYEHRTRGNDTIKP